MIKMTPAHTDSPLRRSDAGVFRETVQNVQINDDEAERRELRRRTLLQKQDNSSGLFEDNETLKKCLEIYNGNKLSKENAWSVSLIDTLSTLLDKHHKSLNNFKVAGSSLEASSKVYGLRVDSIHTDVLRMSAGLNAQNFSADRDNAYDDEDDNDNSRNNVDADDLEKNEAKKSLKSKPKKQRKNLSTVTKNKESLNARLDTVPLVDPVIGKVNSIVGSVNSFNRLLQNVLTTSDSVLHLRLNFPFWDNGKPEKLDYTEEVDWTEESSQLLDCKMLYDAQLDEHKLRPLQSGYILSDAPDDTGCDRNKSSQNNMCSSPSPAPFEDDQHEMSLAFDINAECEPMPPLISETAIVNVDFDDFDDLTNDERLAITHCKGLRKAPVLIEDLRPVDASSKLEYSYRPLDKISQFWAGPSHWKFKKLRNRGNTMNQRISQASSGCDVVIGKAFNQRARARGNRQDRAKQLDFSEYHDDLFVRLDQSKLRKTNVQKKWDHRKLKLPSDLQIDPFIFDKFQFAPSICIQAEGINHSNSSDIQTDLHYADDDDRTIVVGHHANNHNEHFGDNIDQMNATTSLHTNRNDDDDDCVGGGNVDITNMADKTVLEIATDFEGAPRQVTKIIVPFAKRAKVIDMKSLKNSCSKLIQKHLCKPFNNINNYINSVTKDVDENENYSGGIASFQEIYKELPSIIAPAMAEALSPSIACYSILHLANDNNLRLIQEENLKDFKIRKVTS